MTKYVIDSHVAIRLAREDVVAWKIADQLDRADTFDAEYIALTTLQADALITLDAQLATSARAFVEVASFEVLYREP